MDDPRWQASWLERLGIAAVAVAAVGLLAASLTALVPVWPCALIEHFRLQLVVGGIVVVAGAAALQARGSFDVAAIATLVNALWIAADLCRAPRPLPIDGVPIRVLVLNVHTESSSFDRVRGLIDDLRPDVIGLVEVDRRWLDALAPALVGYPGRLEQPRADNFGVALYTRWPVAGSIEALGGRLPSVVADLTHDGAHLGVVLVHPLPPMSSEALDAQRAELDAVADRVRAMATPAIIMGDLNATPWSRPFERLLARSDLCDSRAGFGVQASFPAGSAFLRIPIDHLLASCEIGVRDRHVERDVGSDHLPVVVDLVVPHSTR